MHFLPSSIHSIHAKPKPFLSSPLPGKQHRTGHVHAVSVSCRATTTNNFYEVLSLSPDNASIDEVKKAYRTMALRYHPDVCPPPMKEESTRMFVQLNAAYRTLSDPVLRKEYDCEILMESFGRTFGRTSRMGGVDHDGGTRSRWQQQIVELKRISNCRMAEKEGSWGSRIRANNIMRNKEY